MRLLICAVLLSLPLVSAQAQSRPDMSGMSANEVRRSGDTLLMRGNVTISLDGNVITADQAEVNTATGEMKLLGNVRVADRGLTPEQQSSRPMRFRYASPAIQPSSRDDRPSSMERESIGCCSAGPTSKPTGGGSC
jgi:lipopolysaccharide export system protein LptA